MSLIPKPGIRPTNPSGRSTLIPGLLIALLPLLMSSCTTDQNNFYSLLVITNTNTATPPAGLVCTANGVDEDGMHPPVMQIEPYPVVKILDHDVYVLNTVGAETITKYRSFPNGTFSVSATLQLPAGSGPKDLLITSGALGFCSLANSGKIMIFNPGSLQMTDSIDLSGYGIGDASPDPTSMVLANSKLYVTCVQSYAGKTVPSPAQLLIIDLQNGKKTTSITDDRGGYMGNSTTPSALFFTEAGDLYLYCAGSWGAAVPALSGFLRIKNGQMNFDPSYFFNPSASAIANVEGSYIDYLQHPAGYISGGVVYSTGHIPALDGNPQSYVTDRSFGCFKVDLINQVVTKLKMPYSNGYASTVLNYNGSVYFGLSTSGGAGLFSEYKSSGGSLYNSAMRMDQGEPWFMGTLW